MLPYIFPPTRLAQYLVMFAPFIFILAFFLPASLSWQNTLSAQIFSLRRVLAWWLRLSAWAELYFSSCWPVCPGWRCGSTRPVGAR